jgi:Tfp pilus assembly PilM family ATPase
MKALRSGPRTLPLGIDLGASRVRVAHAQRHDDGTIELVAVATRDHRNDQARAIAEAVAELRTRERRCIFGLGEPSALLRGVRFPPMRRGEQERAARFEATKFIDFPIAEAAVRVVPTVSGESVIGVVRKNAIASLVSIAHAAKLRVTAVDNNSFAFRRAIPDADAVLDIGLDDSRLLVFRGSIPVERRFAVGGQAFTRAIARAFGYDEATAERRKLTHGIAGCAEAELDSLAADVANALVDCRLDGIGDVRSIALAGNGSRVAELPAVLERATGVRVRLVTLDPTVSSTLPPDVLRAGAADWSLAYGLAQWTQA